MPNYVINVVRFQGDTRQLEAMRAAIQDDRCGVCSIDFNKIIPMPKGLFMVAIGPVERELYGANNWMDWSRANWGTKWNAFRFGDDLDDHNPGRIAFVTANGAPHPILKKLSEMYPDIIMRHQWADDNVGYNCGERTYKGGRLIDEYIPDYGTRAVNFACEVMGTTPADHCLKLNEDGTEYVCAEDENMDETMEEGMHL